MPKYLLTYGPGAAAPTTQAEGEAVMAAWGQWLGSLGPALVDPGNPTGPSAAVAPDGSAVEPAMGVTGYSIISAESLDSAVALTKDCPHLAAGGAVEIYETFEVM